jgi:hypothetical protein
MLHLKRPKLFPVLDQLVAQILGAPVSLDASAKVKAQAATNLVIHLRRQGRNNIQALHKIQAQLADDGFERSLVRILDAALWLSHPAAGIGGTKRIFTCGLTEG